MAEADPVLKGKLEELQEKYSKTKYNKATNKYLGELRKKIASLKKDIIESGKREKGSGYFVKKTGDATVALLGFPSAGKSTLINALAKTQSKTAAYAFTTTEIIPGTMVYKDVHVQLFDMPGVIEGAHKGLGGGRSVLAAMKVADLVMFVIDVNITGQLDSLMDELNSFNVHVNRDPPKVSVRESGQNIGLVIDQNKSQLSKEEIGIILNGLGIHNAKVKIGGPVAPEEFISFVSGRACYMRAIVALTKIDTNPDYPAIAKALAARHGTAVVPVSAVSGRNLEELKAEIRKNLGLVTVYLVHRSGKERPMPLVLHRNSTVGEAAAKLHTEIVDQLKCAYVTGPSASFRHQRVGIAHVLEDGDTLTFIKES